MKKISCGAPSPPTRKGEHFVEKSMSQDEAFVHSMFELSKEDPEFVYPDPITYLKLRYAMLRYRSENGQSHSRMYLTARKRVLRERFAEYVKQVEDEKVQHMATEALQRALLAEQNVREGTTTKERSAKAKQRDRATHPKNWQLMRRVRGKLKSSDVVSRVCFSGTDPSKFALGYQNGEIQICSASLTQFRSDLLLSGHSDQINDIDWDTSNTFVISASSDRTMRLWAVAKESSSSNINNNNKQKKNIVRRALIRYCAESSVTASRFCPHNNNQIIIACRGKKSSQSYLIVLTVDTDEFRVLQRIDLSEDFIPRSVVFAEHGSDSELYVFFCFFFCIFLTQFVLVSQSLLQHHFQYSKSFTQKQICLKLT